MLFGVFMDTTIDTTVSGHALEQPDIEEVSLVSVLDALSDPVRLRIVGELAGGEERSCGSIQLPVGKSTCTHHFRVLREAGLIRTRLEGKTRLNSLRIEELARRFPGLVESVLAAAARDGV
jgi:DNA-binding transcriptional ArsR family regulator